MHALAIKSALEIVELGAAEFRGHRARRYSVAQSPSLGDRLIGSYPIFESVPIA